MDNESQWCPFRPDAADLKRLEKTWRRFPKFRKTAGQPEISSELADELKRRQDTKLKAGHICHAPLETSQFQTKKA